MTNTATEQISVRIDRKTKKAAESILNKLGLSPTDAVRMFYRQIAAQRGLPFHPKIPNAETLAAFKEVNEGGGTKMSLEEFKTYLQSIAL